MTSFTVKGHTSGKRIYQTYDINYEETFALIAMINTIKILLSLVTCFDWEPDTALGAGKQGLCLGPRIFVYILCIKI